MKYHNDISKKCEFECGKGEIMEITESLKKILIEKKIKIIEKKYNCERCKVKNKKN